MQIVKNQEMGHFTKGQSGQIRKPKNKLYILPRKVQGETPT
jgi:hypothetical protein